MCWPQSAASRPRLGWCPHLTQLQLNAAQRRILCNQDFYFIENGRAEVLRFDRHFINARSKGVDGEEPTSLVTAMDAWFVAVLTTVTFAPGTVAPVGSVTVPEIEPVAMPCGNPAAASNRQNTLTNNADHSCCGRNFESMVETRVCKIRAFAYRFISFALVNII